MTNNNAPANPDNDSLIGGTDRGGPNSIVLQYYCKVLQYFGIAISQSIAISIAKSQNIAKSIAKCSSITKSIAKFSSIAKSIAKSIAIFFKYCKKYCKI